MNPIARYAKAMQDAAAGLPEPRDLLEAHCPVQFLMEALRVIGAAVEKENKALIERIEAIEKKGVSYRGVYQRADEYRRGDMVTFKGSLWCATSDTRAEPCESNDWQMSVRGLAK